MYVKELDENDELMLKQRREKIRKYQEKGICFSCENFLNGDIFPDGGLVIYEDELVRCQFEKFPRLKGEPIGYHNFVRKEGILIDYQETADLYRKALENIKL